MAMVKLGEINLDGVKGRINLELTDLIEQHLTKDEEKDMIFLWDKMATLIEKSLSRVRG